MVASVKANAMPTAPESRYDQSSGAEIAGRRSFIAVTLHRQDAPSMDESVKAIELQTLAGAKHAAEVDPIATKSHTTPRTARILMLIAVIAPFFGLIAAMLSLWGWGFRWSDLGLLLGMYVLTGIGITVGFHRLFTHRSFETNWLVEFVLAVLGSMAVQGPLLQWVAAHRQHHQHSDHPEDPHSPHHQGNGLWGILRGMWHAHLGWMFTSELPDVQRYVRDLKQSKVIRAVSALFPLWIALGLLIPTAVGWLLVGTPSGAATGFVWGGLVRIFFVHHVTWSINSVCHVWGQQPYCAGDQSRDNIFFGIFGMGEGWHNTHHAFPTSARHGLSWWQIDVSYWVIRGLELVGLAWNVKLPSRAAIARQSRHRGL
jgi:stearoyl-CoA desaturase (delta-9 desaturase)